jgi:hypothetical protein
MVRRSRAAGNALLVQQALRLGWGDQARRREAAAGYYRFVTDHVVAPDGTLLDQRAYQQAVRPYNFPWFAHFLLEAGDTYLAWPVMTRFTLLEVSTSGGSARVSCLALYMPASIITSGVQSPPPAQGRLVTPLVRVPSILAWRRKPLFTSRLVLGGVDMDVLAVILEITPRIKSAIVPADSSISRRQDSRGPPRQLPSAPLDAYSSCHVWCHEAADGAASAPVSSVAGQRQCDKLLFQPAVRSIPVSQQAGGFARSSPHPGPAYAIGASLGREAFHA